MTDVVHNSVREREKVPVTDVVHNSVREREREKVPVTDVVHNSVRERKGTNEQPSVHDKGQFCHRP